MLPTGVALVASLYLFVVVFFLLFYLVRQVYDESFRRNHSIRTFFL